MTRIEHIIASIKGNNVKPELEETAPPKKSLSNYFSKRTPEQIESDRLELKHQEEAKQAKHDFEQEQENERKRQHQPSRFEEDVSKIKNQVSAKVSTTTKRIATGAKRTINVAAPAVKKVVSGTVKTVAPIVKQMGEGSAKIDKEEKSKPKSTLFKPPREDKAPRKLMKMSEGADDYFASGLSKKMPKEEKSAKKKIISRRDDNEFSMGHRNKKIPQNSPQKKIMKQPEGADEFFVSSQKKTPPKPEKKGKDRRGFGLGF